MIIDTFLFFNELDILEVRLRELSPVVDRFVLVESTTDHAGRAKPLHFWENRDRFAAFLPMITHVTVTDDDHDPSLPATRRREMGQRNAILRGLTDAPHDAVVLVSDLDEIPRVVMIPRAIVDEGIVGVCDQTLHYYNVHTRATTARWNGTRILLAKDLRALSPHVARYGLGTPDTYYPRYVRLPHGGWHLSYFGGVAMAQHKMHSFLHQELVTEVDVALLAERSQTGIDPWGRTDQPLTVAAPETMPLAIACDPETFATCLHPDWIPTFHEDWCDRTAIHAVCLHLMTTPLPDGLCLEIGSWEGRSTIPLAHTLFPRTLQCLDTWQGNITEGDSHPSVIAAQERNVYTMWAQNVSRMTGGNVEGIRGDWRVTLPDDPIAFVYLDAEHDEESVYDCLTRILPRLVPGAIVAGDDWFAASVQRAVRRVFRDAITTLGGRIWMYHHPS